MLNNGDLDGRALPRLFFTAFFVACLLWQPFSSTQHVCFSVNVRHCSTDHVLVTPLHTSDHFLLTLNLNMIPDTSHTPPHVTYRLNLRLLSPSFGTFFINKINYPFLSSHPTTCPLDPIPSHLFQAISPAVVPALTHIVNTSLHTGIFTSAFKQARITPLLKKPTLNPTLLGNYRPVFLLPFIAKTLERVVFNQVTIFLTQNNLLDRNQSGFRSGHSTETALLSVVEDLRLARTASKSSLLILLDLYAAFDTVNHQILLSTLLRMGISGTALQWFDSYLSDRTFKVSWRGKVSNSSQHLATGRHRAQFLDHFSFLSTWLH